MHILRFVIATAATIVLTTAKSCNHDNGYRAVARYSSVTSPKFCGHYLGTPKEHIPRPLVTYSPSKVSSACSCLEARVTQAPKSKVSASTVSKSTLATSTCSRTSAAACPTAHNPCCAYLCGEAQVPFNLCSQDDITGEFALCSKCPK